MEKPIYLNYALSTPIAPEVIAAMQHYQELFGDPSRAHLHYTEGQCAIKHSHKQVAALLNCHPDEIVFTSGVTEANNHAIKGVAFAYRGKGNHVITSRVEHPSVTKTFEFLETQGFAVTYLPVDQYGAVNPEDVKKKYH